MINNLFTVFDPSTSLYISLNWTRSIYILIFYSLRYWFIPSRYNYLFILLSNSLENEFFILLNIKINQINIIIYFSLFFYIMLNNLLGLFSYIFTSTRHFRISLPISLTLWVSYILFGWINYWNNIFAQLVPRGTPGVLIPFIFLIESISNVIRSGTLAVRLSANIIAGHLLIRLISSTGNNLSFLSSLLILIGQRLLLLLELSVSIIQAYVFSILRLLYRTESN